MDRPATIAQHRGASAGKPGETRRERAADELAISMIQLGDVSITAGTAKVVVTACLGTRDGDDRFTWSRKIRLELYPDSEHDYPTDQQGRALPHVRLVPPDFMLDLRAALLAIEAYLQGEVDGPAQALPARVSQARARYEHADPRMDLAWRTRDGHNSAPGFQRIPRRGRTTGVRGGGARPGRGASDVPCEPSPGIAGRWREMEARTVDDACDRCLLTGLCQQFPGFCRLSQIAVAAPGPYADKKDADLVLEIEAELQAPDEMR
ncbi:MAG: hypothetical protein JXA09_03950 [Anaerolineae bacterium]|nr:hypothetical protein [Anaerolineae bacterium]